jgi:hypothetical protein
MTNQTMSNDTLIINYVHLRMMNEITKSQLVVKYYSMAEGETHLPV